MADKRMISRSIIRQEKFLDLPLTAQALYMHLLTEADDDGFVGSAKRMARMLGAEMMDLQHLSSVNYITLFPSGVAHITHWHLQNCIRKDRYHPTIFTDERKALGKSFVSRDDSQDDNQLTAEDSIEESSIEKKREEEPKIEKERKVQSKIEESIADAREVDTIDKERAESLFKAIPEDGQKSKRRPFPSQMDVFNFIKDNGIKNINGFIFFSYYNARNWHDKDGQSVDDWQRHLLEWELYGSPIPDN